LSSQPITGNQSTSEWLKSAAEEAGIPLQKIKILQEEPVLYEECILGWNAFWDLNGSRQVTGFGFIGEIPYRDVSDWMTENQIYDSYTRDFFRKVLQCADKIYLKDFYERKEKMDKRCKNQNSRR